MSVTGDDIAEVLKRIPGWGGADWQTLPGGLTNTVVNVTKGSKSGVLKIDSDVRSAPFNSRIVEAQVQRHAASAGLAPRVVFADERVLLSEYVHGDVWTVSSFDVDDNLIRLADALLRLHDLPSTGRQFDARTAAEHYLGAIRRRHSDTAELQDLALAVIDTQESRPPSMACCCHNDLVAANLLATPNVLFLDWEYACDNDPFFDLATIVEHHELSPRQITILLESYTQGAGAPWRDRLTAQRQHYLALLWLWMSSRPNVSPVDVRAVGRRLATSCS